MKRTLLFLMALVMSAGFSFVFAADPSNPDLLSQNLDALYPSDNNGLPIEGSPTYDMATHTISFTTGWSNMGWSFWGADLEAKIAEYQTCTIEFDAVDYPMLAAISNWRTGEGEISRVEIPAGTTKAVLNITKPSTTIVLQCETDQGSFPKTVKLNAAYLSKAGGGTSDIVSLGLPTSDGAGNGNAQQGILVSGIMDQVAAAKYLVLETNGVGDNAGGFGGIHFIFQGNDGGSLNIDWTDVGINGGWVNYSRADGKTVSIAIDLQSVLDGKKDNSGNTHSYADFLKCTGWARFIIAYYGGATATAGLALQDVYLTCDFAVPDGAVNLTGTTGFIFDGSVKDIFGGSGLIPVKLDASNVYNTDGGIIVNGNNENVNIYAIDGRLVKQAVANKGTKVPLQRGLYIVKVGVNSAVKVLVK